HTRFAEMLGISHPVMSAPMTMHCGWRLAAAVSRAGGLGSFGGINPEGPDWVRQQIRQVRSQTDRPFGVGFITQLIPDLPDNFQAVLDENVPVIAFSFSDPKPWLVQAKDSGALVMCQVQSVEGAEAAVSAGADVLVAQGNEAGGHTGGMNSLPFLVSLLNRYPQLPVLASGGISEGRGLAAVLAAGADGAWVGTAFLATPEAVEVPDTFKERILLSDGQDTAFTRLYDQLGDTPWPQGIGGRVYRNRFVRQWDGREGDIIKNREELVSDAAQAWERHDPDRASVYMGQSAGGVNSIRPAARVLQDICDQAETLLRERCRDLLHQDRF
ncbi:MAG TPA: nitronate monooxygenase, partial [Dehalococcoidia bacterium]|nr:nitronate monooxygenase [Dehalococcoidia bacterium]